MRQDIFLWILFLFLVLAILNFVPTTVVYNTTESYTEYIPYTEEVPFKYEIVDPPRWFNENLQMKIKNTDNVSGTYNVSFIIESDVNATKKIFNRSAILSPGRIGVVGGVSRSDIEMTGNITISFTVIPGMKTLEKTWTEIKTREVTKEKEVGLLEFILHLY